ncbi:hypothetical protein Ahy_A05g024910 isoform B [Arachis hypogaea]|uniref:Methyltransferase type 11 domain-containing protein n=1 Tax=Arachis hypogaea TaxID=3818 RepID=A0A445D7F5_ARAHY|nr:hypothetical protein Ahy_A05g024910 isoform B [Arachis hypogaea]
MALLATATVAFKTINTQIRNRSFLPLQKHLSLSSSLSSFSFFRTVSGRAMELERKNSTVIDENGVLKKGIAEFYDESSAIWEDIWGDHMHHGFYPPDSTVSLSDHRAAQIQMIEQALRFASIPLEDERKWPKKIVDVGCGIGGSSRYLTQKFGATAVGITLSPVQVQRANALAAAQGLANKCIAVALQDLVWFEILNLELFRRPFCEMGTGQVSFQVADALDQPFPDGQFDLVWSMESGEHMPDKAKVVLHLFIFSSEASLIKH